MKKMLLFLFIGVLFSACSDEVYNNYYTLETHTQYYKIKEKDWIPVTDDHGQFLYYYCTFKENLLTNKVLDNHASLNAYLYYNVSGEGDTFSPLPYTDFLIDQHGTPWEGHLTVEYQVGYIVFNLKINDLNPAIPRSVYDIMVSIPKVY
ncbi:hypothetical protein FACS1894176_00160 [Bacteroidia bacterium]|nr:hypothetical protein FACS1894176_00160 [Bacteroidia bacterium]